MKKHKKGVIIASSVFMVLLAVVLVLANRYNLLPQKTYTGGDFGITPVLSGVDFNGNGTDDYTDFLLGARKDARNRPKYDGRYLEGGFPPDNIGVCTDVIWRAFKNAGYNLREMVDKDIAARPKAYTEVERSDKNIDFRRVKNLHVFFEEHAVSLTTDINEVGEWQAGDIVIFDNDRHIGMISDKRNKHGQPYVIHNGGQPKREEDYLGRAEVTSHYRFDAELADGDILVKWED